MAKEGVELLVDVPPDVWVLCDDRLLSQVLVNLVANALKFTSLGFVLVRVGMLQSEKTNIRVRGCGSDAAQSCTESSRGVYALSKKQLRDTSKSHRPFLKYYGNKHKTNQNFPVDIEQHSPSSSRSRACINHSMNVSDKSKEQFLFEVCDAGPGITKEQQVLLFQKFQQVGNHFGAGIGLMLSQKIIQNRGGHIDLVSPSWVNEISGSLHTGLKLSFNLDLRKVDPNTELGVQETRKNSCAEAVNSLMVFNSSSVRAAETNKILENLFGMRMLLVDDSMTNLKQLRHKFTKQAPFSQLAWNCSRVGTNRQSCN